MDTFMQQIINGLVLGSMYALVALGYTMVYGIIGLINFAHGEVLMVGALTSWTAIGFMKDAMPGAPGYLILLLSLVIACVVAACLNFVIEKVAYRPLRNSPKLAPLITAIGVSILLQTLAMIIWKPNYKPFPTLLPSTPMEVAGAVITPSIYSFAFRTVIVGRTTTGPWSKRRAISSSAATAFSGSLPSSGSISTAKWARAVSVPSRATAA